MANRKMANGKITPAGQAAVRSMWRAFLTHAINANNAHNAINAINALQESADG
jgi:hypothetical protein